MNEENEERMRRRKNELGEGRMDEEKGEWMRRRENE